MSLKNAESKYHQQPCQKNHYNISNGNNVNRINNCYDGDISYTCSSSNENCGNINHFCWKSNSKRYRTTGKLITKHRGRDLGYHHYR
jgi:hypothetical protein